MVVDCIWKNSKAVVEKEDKEEDNQSKSAKLNTCANLASVRNTMNIGSQGDPTILRVMILPVSCLGVHIVLLAGSTPT